MKVYLPVPSRPHNFNPLSLWTRTKYQIFLTIYFCTRFFCDKKFCINIFLRHRILHVYFGVCCFFAIKNKCTNILTQTIVMQKILMQKIMLQKKTAKIFVDFFLQQQLLCQKLFVKNFAQKIFV